MDERERRGEGEEGRGEGERIRVRRRERKWEKGETIAKAADTQRAGKTERSRRQTEKGRSDPKRAAKQARPLRRQAIHTACNQPSAPPSKPRARATQASTRRINKTRHQITRPPFLPPRLHSSTQAALASSMHLLHPILIRGICFVPPLNTHPADKKGAFGRAFSKL